jgi:hypothetical protein
MESEQGLSGKVMSSFVLQISIAIMVEVWKQRRFRKLNVRSKIP